MHKLYAIKSGWSSVYIVVSRVIFTKNIEFLSMKIDFVLEISADADEMNLGLNSLPKYPLRVSGPTGLNVQIQVFRAGRIAV